MVFQFILGGILSLAVIYIIAIYIVNSFWPRVRTAWFTQVSQLRNMYIQFTNTKILNRVLE